MAEHLLERRWRVWQSDRVKKPKGDRSNSGADSFTAPSALGDFVDVAGYWTTISKIPKPSRLQIVDVNYYVFQVGVTPSWEDDANRNGGRWTFAVDNKTVRDADKAWLDTHLALVGETLDPAFEVTGISLTCRKFYTRVSVWTRNRDNTQMVLTVGDRLKKLTKVAKVEYQDHGAAFEVYRFVI